MKLINSKLIYQSIFQILIKRLDQGQTEARIKKKRFFDSAKTFYEDRELVLNNFKSGLFPLKSTKGTGLKILTLKQMFQRLPKALEQV